MSRYRKIYFKEHDQLTSIEAQRIAAGNEFDIEMLLCLQDLPRDWELLQTFSRIVVKETLKAASEAHQANWFRCDDFWRSLMEVVYHRTRSVECMVRSKSQR